MLNTKIIFSILLALLGEDMMAFLQSSGSCPSLRDFWKITVKGSFSSLASCLRNIGSILSGPTDLFVSKLLSFFKTASGESINDYLLTFSDQL